MGFLRFSWLPVGILAFALGLTWQLWEHEQEVSKARLRTHFDYALQETISRIEQRMGAYELLLRGVQSQYAAMGKVDRKGMQDYVSTLQLDANFSGVQAIGFAEWVPGGHKAEHVARMHRLGIADYTILPAGNREAYAPVVQREPYVGRNRAPFGFDPWSDPVRRQAMARARDSGMPAITGKVKLKVETEDVENPGFVMYLPIYGGKQAGDGDKGRKQLLGWVFASFRMSDMMASLYGQLPPGLAFQVHDGVEISDKSLLYRADESSGGQAALFSANEYLVIGGHTWTLGMNANQDFVRHFGRSDARLIAWSGIGVSLLLTLVAWLLTSSRTRAVRLAQSMTSELRHFKAIVQSSEDAIISKSLQGIVTSWNPGAAALFGYREDEMLGKSLQALLGEAQQAEEAEMLKRIRQGEHIEHFETTRRCKDGSVVTIAATISPIIDADGRIVGVSSISRDITAQKQVAAELASYREHLEVQVQQRTAALSIAKEAAEAANRAKSIFLATMSHELRTPMNAIMGLTEIVRRKTVDPAQGELLGKVLGASHQLLEIINDILELSRIEAEPLALAQENFNLQDCLARVEASFLPAIRNKELAFHLEIVPDLVGKLIKGDPVRLEQILSKLMSNAIKFTAAGYVRLGVSIADDRGSDLLLRFEVADSGIGIPLEEQGRLFSAFEQIDGSSTRRFGGTGLGLAISKRLVVAMNGTIGVDSQFGVGSRFWFTVPMGKSA